MDWFWTVYAFVIGLCIGSFLNVVVLRGFSGESIVLPPSHCPKCDHKLAWYDNIPVFSYLLLGGKCRYCKEKISIQYPVVELFTGIIFAGIYYKYSFGLTEIFNVNILFLWIAAALCIAITVTDIKEKVIFVIHTYILAGLGLVYNFFNISLQNSAKITVWLAGVKLTVYQSFIYSVLGLVAGFFVLFTIAKIAKFITKKDCFGDGDAYILGALGAFFGVSNAIVILILSIFIWGGLSIPVFLYKWFKNKEYKLLSGMLLFIITTALFLTGEYLNIFTSDMFRWFTYILVASIGLYCCRLIIASIKNNDKPAVIPYGPALIFGAFVVMFLL